MCCASRSRLIIPFAISSRHMARIAGLPQTSPWPGGSTRPSSGQADLRTLVQEVGTQDERKRQMEFNRRPYDLSLRHCFRAPVRSGVIRDRNASLDTERECLRQPGRGDEPEHQPLRSTHVRPSATEKTLACEQCIAALKEFTR